MIEIESDNIKLNNIVYQIYNLNEREINIIENDVKN